MFMRHIHFIFQYFACKKRKYTGKYIRISRRLFGQSANWFISGAWGLHIFLRLIMTSLTFWFSWTWKLLRRSDGILFLHGVSKLKSRKVKNLKGFQLKWKCSIRRVHASLNLLTILNYFRITASLYQSFSWRCLFRSLTSGGAWCVSHTDIWARPTTVRLRDRPKRGLLQPVHVTVFRAVLLLTESLGDAKEASKPLHLDENNFAFQTFIRRDVVVTFVILVCSVTSSK